MGIVANITAEKFPEQGPWLGKKVRVCFHFDSSRELMGTVVREDNEPPGVMIIRLEDGRHVLSSECHYRPPRD